MNKINKFRLYLRLSKNIVSALFSKCLVFFGFNYDNSVIPSGPYCYLPDEKKNAEVKSYSVYYIIPCPYFMILSERWRACRYLGVITDDFVFRDQCKMCGENDDYNDIK